MSTHYGHSRLVITRDNLYHEVLVRGDKDRSHLRIGNRHQSDINGRKVMWSYETEITTIFTSIDTLAKLRGKTLSFVMSVCPPV
jgi:hypothetical protein